MSFPIAGKVALVTGANRGIGKSIVSSLLKHGAAKVYAAVRNPETMADVVRSSGGKVVAVPFDLSKPETILAAAKQTSDVQLVINNAGVLTVTDPLAPNAIEALQYENDVNLYGLLRIAQAYAPILEKNGGGALVQLNSVVSMKSFANFATYSASKAAAYSLTQALRERLKGQGTLVVSVHPGPIATDMGDAAGLTAIAEPPEVVGEAIVEGLTTGRFHVFPDTMARNIGGVYQSFATGVVEADMGAA